MKSLVNTPQSLHSNVSKQLTELKIETRKLEVRLLAVERYQKLSETTVVDTGEDDEVENELTSNIEAVKYDLSTYLRQLKDRVAHIERGLSSVNPEALFGQELNFLLYIDEDARLCLRDVAIAREGYDELIENLRELRHLRDNDL